MVYVESLKRIATLANHQLCILTVTTELGVHFIWHTRKQTENERYNIARVLALHKSYWVARKKVFIYARACVSKMTCTVVSVKLKKLEYASVVLSKLLVCMNKFLIKPRTKLIHNIYACVLRGQKNPFNIIISAKSSYFGHTHWEEVSCSSSYCFYVERRYHGI